jgi:acyl carrier protein
VVAANEASGYNSSMNEAEIISKICELLGPYNLEGKTLAAETDIPAELNIDSVGVLDFIMEVEDHFDIEIPMNVVSETRTVGDLARYVAAQKNKA